MIQGPILYGPPEKPGRPRGGLLGPWRPESCGPVPAQAGTSGSGKTDILCASEPDGLAAGAGALPGARRRCEAGKRTHGPGPRACLALLAATALLALAAPAQAQPTTVTQSGDGATWSLVGENTVAAGQQTYTYTLTRTSGSLPLNEYFGFTSDTLEAERFQDGYSDCTGTNYFCFTLSNSYSYSEYTVSNVRFAGRILTDTSPHVLTLKVATGTPAGTTVTLGVVRRSGVPRSGGLQITVGTAPTNTAPTVANTIPNQTATAGTAFSYAFLANTFADTDPGDTLTYTATQSDDTALPSWLSFAAATRTFSGTPTAADVGTVSVKVTASDGHGGSVSDTFDIVVSAACDGRGQHPCDGRADDHRHGAGRRADADGGHHRRRSPDAAPPPRADQRQLHVPVDPGGHRQH